MAKTKKINRRRKKAPESTGLAPAGMRARPSAEVDCALEFEEAAYLTLGLCYDQNGRFAGGGYHPLLKRVDELLDKPIQKALEERERHVKKLLEIEAKVGEIVAALKAKGLESPYLKSFVVARLNPLRFRRDATLPIDEALEKMLQAAERFSTEKISVKDLARSGGM